MLYIITREDCPYCSAAKRSIDRILKEKPALQELQFAYLEEKEDVTSEYDYYYTPAFFWDKEKLAEGSFAEETVAEILSRAHNLQRQSTE